MKRIHFDRKGSVNHHYFFWEPWGFGGCLLRGILFMVLLFVLLYLLAQFRSCSRAESRGATETVPDEIVEVVEPGQGGGVPPIREEDIIEDEGRRIVSNRLNVLFGAETGQSDMERWAERFKELYPEDGYEVLFSDPNTKLMAIQVPSERRVDLITELPLQIPDIPFRVFDETVMDVSASSDDPFLADRGKAWYFGPVDAFRAWDKTRGSTDVVVAVVDSYFDLNNPEFANTNIVSPYNVQTGTDDVGVPEDFNPNQPDLVLSHGTMVGSIVVGAADNAHGSAGIASACSFMPVSLGRRFGCFAMLQGLLYAINHGAQVVNISAGMSFTDAMANMSVEQQIEIARREFRDQEAVWKYVFDMADKFYVTIVWAAGNENVFTALDASKRGDNTIKVSAVDKSMSKAMFSNFGNFPERRIYESTVSAPGVGIYGEVPRGGTAQLVDGTSFSAPIVSGAVGLVKSLDPTLTTQSIASIFKATGQPVRQDRTIGPVVRIGAALDSVIGGFIPFYDFMGYYSGTAPVPAVLPTTFLRALEADGEDPTRLPPLITINFEFTDRAVGKVRYVSNLSPDNPWVADFVMSHNNGRVLISQPDKAFCNDSTVAPFGSAVFTVSAGSYGEAEIINVESESIVNNVYRIKRPG